MRIFPKNPQESKLTGKTESSVPDFGRVASSKVLIQLFQKLAGVEGTASLIEARKPRNTQDFIKSSFFRFLFSSLKEKRKNNILETINGVSQITF